MLDSHRQTDIEAAIRALAQRHRIAYRPTGADARAHHIARLAGDDLVFEETEQLLIALQRTGHLSRTEAVLLQVDYLRQAKP